MQLTAATCKVDLILKHFQLQILFYLFDIDILAAHENTLKYRILSRVYLISMEIKTLNC